jgi:hypothetical protein
MVTRTMVEMHASDPSYISRILDVCQELKVPMTSSLIDGSSCLVKTVQCLIKIAVLKSLRNHLITVAGNEYSTGNNTFFCLCRVGSYCITKRFSELGEVVTR